MALLTFNDLSFEEKPSKIRVTFLRIFYTDIKKTDLNKIGTFKIKNNEINFKDKSYAKVTKRFNFLLAESFKNLKSKITNKPTIYIHQNSGIPLIGNQAFGLIDRNTSIIEVRIITGCNLDCIYCSVDQDKRPTDFVVEKDYLIQEFKKLIQHKEINNIEAHIGTQGEPLLYSPLTDLIKDLSDLKQVSTIALDTNGTLLTKTKVDELVDAGLTRFCFSINASTQDSAEKIAGAQTSDPDEQSESDTTPKSKSDFSRTSYNLKNILKLLEYISKKDCELILTPVWMPKINDKDIEELIKLSKKLKCKIGIQNFLNYRFGKNPAKQMPWEEFIKKMKLFEKKYNAHLLFDFKEDFNIRQTEPLEKPFKKGNTIKAKIICPGRLKNEMVAVANNRSITIPNCFQQINKTVKLKITRSKHNIFYGVLQN